jgi:hypothetical protein
VQAQQNMALMILPNIRGTSEPCEPKIPIPSITFEVVTFFKFCDLAELRSWRAPPIAQSRRSSGAFCAFSMALTTATGYRAHR